MDGASTEDEVAAYHTAVLCFRACRDWSSWVWSDLVWSGPVRCDAPIEGLEEGNYKHYLHTYLGTRGRTASGGGLVKQQPRKDLTRRGGHS